MDRIVGQDLTVVANGTVTFDAAVGQSGKTKRLKWVSAEAHDSIDLVVYLDQDLVCQAPMACDAFLNQLIPLNVEIGVGQTLKVGILDHTSGVANFNVAACIEES